MIFRLKMNHLLIRKRCSLMAPVCGLYYYHKSSFADTSSSAKIYSVHTYPANNPSEDRFDTKIKKKWNACAVFDGHGGWQVSDFSSKSLLDTIIGNVDDIDTTDEIALDAAITNSFQEVESNIINSIRSPFKIGFGEVAKVGSCVLVALKNENRLVVANCGDCRAILGTESGLGNTKNASNVSFVSTRLNREHNARIRLEQLFLSEQHGCENNLVVCKSMHACYVKGRLQVIIYDSIYYI